MRFVDLIEKKADGGVLSREEIKAMITGYVNGDIPDYQMSAMMMAIRLNGMSAEETADLTLAMMHSGDVVDLSDLPGVKLDKHSTGGVGDTTTLVIVPLVAACGGTVAKMSGRGLGHTGGTLDKLESIPGTCIEQPMEVFKDIVRKNGAAVIGQSANLVPADKMMYALRDVTGTVRSIPLIASSIMSKKLASGADVIVLDIKTGTGAFMRTEKEAFELAHTMVDIGTHLGRKVCAIVTDMDQPLGMAVGNALEVREAVQLLSGMIPETDPLYEVCMVLAVRMLVLGGLAADSEEAEKMLKRAIDNGSGLEKLRNMIALQGGDASYIDPVRIDELCSVRKLVELPARRSGYISGMNAEGIGNAAQKLGAGRATKDDIIDPAVGLIMRVRLGDKIEEGDSICTLYVNDDSNLPEIMEQLYDAVRITEEPADTRPMVLAVI
ncbi:MAG: thymidine phosphorylase [Solobacterium sp.]|nr:thymidine phosphorylase [Solobacterium sp.]